MPEARATPEMKAWADAYKAKFGLEPDGLALGQYDGVMMALTLIAGGADTPEKLMAAFHATTYKGVAMTYKSNGKGDMAHDADIVCWDGTSRIPSRGRALRGRGDDLEVDGIARWRQSDGHRSSSSSTGLRSGRCTRWSRSASCSSSTRPVR